VLPSGGHVYYFSPRAADFAQDVFDEFGGAACSEPADLDTLKKVKF
jgi:hypothetical protein